MTKYLRFIENSFLLFPFLYLFAIFILIFYNQVTGCGGKCYKVVINEKPIYLKKEWKVFKNFNLKNKCGNVTLLLELPHNFKELNFLKAVKIGNDVIKPQIELLGSDGKVFKARYFIKKWGFLGIKFDKIPERNEIIKRIRIKFSKKILCNRIIWCSYVPEYF